MTPQEQQMIDGLIERIRNTQVTDRDPEAAAHLQQGLGGNPDAIYILAQTTLVQQQALLQAQSQLQTANAELAKLRDAAGHPPQQASGSWLDRFFGTSSAAPQQPQYGQQQTSYPPIYSGAQQPQYSAPVYAPQQQYPPQQYPPQGYAQPGYGQPAGGSFLRNAAQTAAGVAAGALIFEGVEHMFEGGHSGYGGGGYGGREGETTINNYYEDRPQGGEHHAEADNDSSFYNPSHDASRDSGGLSSASEPAHHEDTGSSQDFAAADTSNSDDFSSNDAADSAEDGGFTGDSSSFDDGGSSNDNG